MDLRSNRKRSLKAREMILSVRELHEQKTVQRRGRKRVHQACTHVGPTQQKERRLDKQAEYEVANKRLGETSEQNKDRQGAKKSRR